MAGLMITGAGILLVGFLAGYFFDTIENRGPKQTIELADPYEKYRNKDGLLSAKTIKESSGK